MKSFILSCVLAVVWLSAAWADEPIQRPLTADPLPDGTAAAVKALATFRIPAGLKVELFAAEPQLGNPVAICLDERNRVYVAEEYRFNRGTEENRTRPFLLDDDLQLRSIDDRLAMFRKYAEKFEGGMAWFSKWTDQVRQLTDRDGDGRSDHTTIFATNFNEPLAGMASGVIAKDGDVYLTNIPHLWRLRDADGDGVAEVREKVLSGFGLNAGFLGHDLHGLAWGPDGKLYFSVGDRGFDVKTKEGTVATLPRRGAVFRCQPDGTEFEVVHIGLRNPQELAFDQYGNLFAADNNCDKGDHSRLVYVVEGGDSGWNMAFQTIADPYLTGPWHAEKMWHVDASPEVANTQPAWLTPAVGPLGAGPSGFAYYPGTGLPARYAEHFFMCNYTGNGGIESFAVQPRGAGFTLVDQHDFFKPISATDCEFGYDGRMYVSDFVGLEWNGGSKGGRIYTLHDPTLKADPTVRQVQQLFHEGFRQREIDELATLLRHADQRVRLRAQYALVERGEKALGAFRSVATESQNRLARFHAIWGLGQLLAPQVKIAPPLRAESLKFLLALLTDQDAEVRCQAARAVGERGDTTVVEPLIALLADAEPRVRFFAAMALAKRKSPLAVEPLIALLRANNNADRYLRHAGVFALAEIGDRAAVKSYATDPDAAVRLAVLLVERRWNDSELVRFLADVDVVIVTEAARAINDLQFDPQTPALAALGGALADGGSELPEALIRRVMHANFRLGEAQHAAVVANVSANPKLPMTMRREALAALADWSTPSQRDRVTGFWRPLSPRDPAIVRGVLESQIASLLANATGPLQTDTTQLVAKLQLKVDDKTFFNWLHEKSRSTSARVAALQLLTQRKHARLAEAVTTALKDDAPQLRAAARRTIMATDPQRALQLFSETLAQSSAAVMEKQDAFLALAEMKQAKADELLTTWLDRLAKRDVPPELQLDLLEAAAQRTAPPIKEAWQRYQDQASAAFANDSLAHHRIVLHGGDAARGRELFANHRQAQCIRCHKVGGQGGDAGPDLSHVANKNDRDYLLQSLLEPNAKIATGFGTVTVSLNDGRVIGGILKNETPTALTIVTPTGEQRIIATADIDERSPATSAMPTMLKVLGNRDLRDLVEFLASLKDEAK